MALQVLNRAPHYTDYLIGKDGSNWIRKRVISNWINFKRHEGAWLPSDQVVENADAVPDLWEGPQFTFTKKIERGPAQLWFGDTSDQDNTTAIGLRWSSHPRRWLQFKMIGVNPVQPTYDAPNKRAIWANAYTKTHLAYQAKRNGFRKVLKLTAPGHQASYSFWLRIPITATLELGANGGEIKGPGGNVRFRIRRPHGWDSDNGANEDREIGKRIRIGVALVSENQDAHGKIYRIRLTPNANDLDDATYPVYLDPPTVISGVGSIEDNFMDANAPTNNNGGHTYLVTGKNPADSSILLRVKQAAIPSGTVTLAELKAYTTAWAGSTNTKTYDAMTIKDANNWVEGTAIGYQAGSSSWNYTQNMGVQWAGSVGCNTSGTDFDADGSPPTITITAHSGGADIQRTWTLRNQDLQDWQTGARTDNGLVILANPSATAGGHLWKSTENAGSQPTVEVTVSSGPPSQGLHFMMGRR